MSLLIQPASEETLGSWAGLKGPDYEPWGALGLSVCFLFGAGAPEEFSIQAASACLTWDFPVDAGQPVLRL